MAKEDTARGGGSDTSVRIALEGLVSARWVLLLILIAVGIFGELVPSLGTDSIRWFGERSNLPAIIATVVLWGGSNLAAQLCSHQLAACGHRVAGFHLVVDIVALTVLIGLTGGAANPFTVLFVVPITLATQVSPRWTWGVAIASVIAFGILLEFAPGDSTSERYMVHGSMGGGHGGMGDHLRGMWLSLGLAGALITFFVHRIALGIAQQRDELTRLRDAARADRELARIGSLAAGAAHELGTPLATLAVLAGELEHMEGDEEREAMSVMRGEIARCKRIIGSMASSELRAEALSLSDIDPWTLDELADGCGKTTACTWEGGELEVSFVPKALVEGILEELVKNAQIASDTLDGVRVVGTRDSAGMRLQVIDNGRGMSDEVLAAATDPFYSTKEKPESMGLGLFLVSAQLRTYGGELSIQSAQGEGTTIEIFIPGTETV
ncbi:MAG: HAMP domain-containing histidine kinase [Myxococcales bacterium]|nr:HAMP domain-containing histidine kinase [Myxococcales bacterium]